MDGDTRRIDASTGGHAGLSAFPPKQESSSGAGDYPRFSTEALLSAFSDELWAVEGRLKETKASYWYVGQCREVAELNALRDRLDDAVRYLLRRYYRTHEPYAMPKTPAERRVLNVAYRMAVV